MAPEGNDSNASPAVECDMEDTNISVELAQSLMKELAAAKTQLQATRRELHAERILAKKRDAEHEETRRVLQETRCLLHKSQRKLEQTPDLHGQVSALQTQLKEKEAELLHSRAALGLVYENQVLPQTRVNAAARSSNAISTQRLNRKRVRSPSLEIIEIRRPAKKDKSEEVEVIDAPKSSIKRIVFNTEAQNAPSGVAPPKEVTSQTSGRASKDPSDGSSSANREKEEGPPVLKRIKREMLMEDPDVGEKKTAPEKAAADPSLASTSTQTQNTTQPPNPFSTQQASASTTEATPIPQPSKDKLTSIEKVPSTSSSNSQIPTQPSAASLTPQVARAIAATLTVPLITASPSNAPSAPQVPGPPTTVPAPPTTVPAPTITQATQPLATSLSNQTQCPVTYVTPTTIVGKGHPTARREPSSKPLPSSSTNHTITVPTCSSPVKAASAKSKTKSTGPTLPNSVLGKYLEPCQTLTISPPPLKLEFPRLFLTKCYKASLQSFVAVVTRNPSGPESRRIVFPMLDCNPFVPSNPGEPGLIFASRHEILSNPPWTVFVKRSNAPPAVWMYQGEYECTLCGTMTTEEFKSQTTDVQRRWAKEVLTAITFDVYVIMRARIALRLAGLIPLGDKAMENALIQDEMSDIKQRQGRRVSIEDTIAAFHRGDEASIGIDIIRMNCVKYDHVFANDMEGKYLSYKPNKGKVASRKSPNPLLKRKSTSIPAPPARAPATPEGRSQSRPTASVSTVSEGTLRRSSRQRSTRLPFMDGSADGLDEDADEDYSRGQPESTNWFTEFINFSESDSD